MDGCLKCRFHSLQDRKVPEDTQDTQMLYADEPAQVIFCRAAEGPYAGKEVGFEPVQCETFAPGQKQCPPQVDGLLARWASRSVE